jgi:hypothetical protein
MVVVRVSALQKLKCILVCFYFQTDAFEYDHVLHEWRKRYTSVSAAEILPCSKVEFRQGESQ